MNHINNNLIIQNNLTPEWVPLYYIRDTSLYDFSNIIIGASWVGTLHVSLVALVTRYTLIKKIYIYCLYL